MVEATPEANMMDSVPTKKPAKKDLKDRLFTGPHKFVCSERPASYSYYDKLNLDWQAVDNYHCYHKLGRGKYSEVYEGCNLVNNEKCVIKILKPVRIEKQYREVKIL